MRFSIIVGALALTVALAFTTGCETSVATSPTESRGPVTSSKNGAGYITATADTFRMVFCLPIPCTYSGCQSCGKLPKPRYSVAETEFDGSIGSPGNVASYFSSSTNYRDSLFPHISYTEPTLYSQLTSGNYWIIKQNETHNGQSVKAYYIGNHQTPSVANATKAFLAD